MKIFTFRAASLQEALMLVRHELGPEASVIQTREISGKLFGWLGKPQIEVQASRDAQVVRRLADVAMAPSETVGAATGTAVAEKVPHNRGRHEASQASRFDMTEEDTDSASSLLNYADADSEVDELPIESTLQPHGNSATSPRPMHSDATMGQGQFTSGALNGFGNNVGSSVGNAAAGAYALPSGNAPNYLTPAMFEVFTEMLDADVDPDAARLMLQEVALHCTPVQLNDPWLIKGRLCQIIQQRIRVSGPIDVHSGVQQIVALVGPTGVGKTTTLAKLAAGFHFDQGIQVGMITLDTFRMGAVDQLQKYADLLGAACEVVASPDQMVPAIYRLRHCPLILIDTAGRSPRDQSQLKVLREFLQAAEPTQTHLVLSAASSPAHAELAMEQFQQLSPTHLLLTKLDEALCLGNWYGPLAGGQWPLSYLTTGQRVPEDIVTANSRRVASLILGQVRT